MSSGAAAASVTREGQPAFRVAIMFGFAVNSLVSGLLWHAVGQFQARHWIWHWEWLPHDADGSAEFSHLYRHSGRRQRKIRLYFCDRFTVWGRSALPDQRIDAMFCISVSRASRICRRVSSAAMLALPDRQASQMARCSSWARVIPFESTSCALR